MTDLTTDTIHALLAPCREIARRAGLAIQAVAAEDLNVEEKSDGSPLTRADRASHECIAAGLAELSPPLPLLSEEGDVEAFQASCPPTFWLIDPLDGTKEFVHRRTDYTVNIALVYRTRPVLGVVYAPALDTMWFAAQGTGAYRQAGQHAPTNIAPSAAARPRSAVASRSHLSEQTQAFLQRNGIEQFTSHGSSIKLCAVAEGKADIYPRHGPTNIWDTAAAAAVAIEAGCRVVALDGTDLSYDPAEGLLREGFLVHPRAMTFEN